MTGIKPATPRWESLPFERVANLTSFLRELEVDEKLSKMFSEAEFRSLYLDVAKNNNIRVYVENEQHQASISQPL